ncbi:MAG TPA: alpha/beta hydrolase [Polyangiaceae bacterium]|nr:alpha/beta hydrolase [Polyangiaceae bacterium]
MALLALGAASSCSPSSQRSARLALEPCRLDGLSVEARCGRFEVWENRRTREGRRLELKVAVVPALAANPRRDPLFVLVGGPGQAATEAGPQIAEALREVQRRRDIVLLDQRGTGSSHPLDCKDDSAEAFDKRFAPELDLATTRACAGQLAADLTQYTTDIAMDDLDDLRIALGYERINLWGGSYGTRAALVYLRQHPAQVRSLVLDGMAPFAIELPLFVARDSQRALDLLYRDCERDGECARTFPGARAQLEQLLAGLQQSPASVSVAHPRSGEPQMIRVEREGLAAALANLLYVPALASLIPLGVERASRGDWTTLAGATEAFSSTVDISVGMFLSVACAEDISRITDEEAAEQTRGTFLGPGWLSRLRQQCEAWHAAQLPSSFFEPVRGTAPSLLLSGQLDPVTPPSWGDQVAQALTPSRHVIVPGGGHGVSTLGCVPELISDFLESLDLQALQLDCVERLQRPPFFLSLEGPSP